MIKYDIAGNWVTSELMRSIENRNCEIVPQYKFTKNKIDDMFQTKYLSGIKDDPSYESYFKREIVRDFKENFWPISEVPVSSRNIII